MTITPDDYGLRAWTFDPAFVAGSITPTDAEVYLLGVQILFPTTIENVHCHVQVAGATVVNSYAGLYDADGVQLGVTAQIGDSLETTGFKTLALTAPVAVEAGWYYIALLPGGGGTDAQFLGHVAPTVAAANLGKTADFRIATHNAGSQTTLPATVTPEAAGALNLWAALS